MRYVVARVADLVHSSRLYETRELLLSQYRVDGGLNGVRLDHGLGLSDGRLALPALFELKAAASIAKHLEYQPDSAGYLVGKDVLTGGQMPDPTRSQEDTRINLTGKQ